MLLIPFLFAHGIVAFAQNGVIKGKIVNRISNEPVAFANIVVQGTLHGATANERGDYEITGLLPGQYNVQATFVGFSPAMTFEVPVTSARPAYVNFALE